MSKKPIPFAKAAAALSPPARPSELFITATQRDAVHAGFKPDGRHHLHAHLFAWWPGRHVVSELATRRFISVVIDSGVGRFLYQEARRHEKDGYEQACIILKTGQQIFGDAAIWVEF